MTSALAAVDVEYFARYEAGGLKIENRLDDVGHLAHMPDGVQRPEGCVGLDRVH
jgi:hypothetical protein